MKQYSLTAESLMSHPSAAVSQAMNDLMKEVARTSEALIGLDLVILSVTLHFAWEIL